MPRIQYESESESDENIPPSGISPARPSNHAPRTISDKDANNIISQFLDSSVSAATLKSYKQGWEEFTNFCATESIRPLFATTDLVLKFFALKGKTVGYSRNFLQYFDYISIAWDTRRKPEENRTWINKRSCLRHHCCQKSSRR